MAAVGPFLHPVVIPRDSQTAELGGMVWGIQLRPLIGGGVQGAGELVQAPTVRLPAGRSGCPGLLARLVSPPTKNVPKSKRNIDKYVQTFRLTSVLYTKPYWST